MTTPVLSDTILISTVVEVPRILDAERAELLESLEASRADMAAGNYDVLKSDMLQMEFEAILANPDISDEELDALLGIGDQKTPDSQ